MSKSVVMRNNRRKMLNAKYKEKRAELKKQIMNKNLTVNERFTLSLQLSGLPRDSSPSRIRNRCRLTGRPRGYYRLFDMSRICVRNLANNGLLPGVLKSSW